MWGDQYLSKFRAWRARYTPTNVGMPPFATLRLFLVMKHPHLCGDITKWWSKTSRFEMTFHDRPTPARARRPQVPNVELLQELPPQIFKESKSASRAGCTAQTHPHVSEESLGRALVPVCADAPLCGETLGAWASSAAKTDLPPHMRGDWLRTRNPEPDFRHTPTPAGRPDTRGYRVKSTATHPQARGEICLLKLLSLC